MRLHGERALQLAVAQNLDLRAQFADQSGTDEQVRSDRRAGRKNVQALDIHDGVFHARRIVESALRNAPAQRHLAALKTRAARVALAGFLSLVALARRFAELRADPASHAHLAVPRTARRLQIGKVHCHVVLKARSRAKLFPAKNAGALFLDRYSSTTTRWRTFRIMPRTSGVSGCSTTWFMRRKPRPRMVCRMPLGQAMKLRTHLIFSLPDVLLAMSRFHPARA